MVAIGNSIAQCHCEGASPKQSPVKRLILFDKILSLKRRLLRREKRPPRNDLLIELMIHTLQFVIRLEQTKQNQIRERMHLVKHFLPGSARMDIGFTIDFHHRFDQHISEK